MASLVNSSNSEVLTHQSPVVTMRTTSLTFNNSTFCSHSTLKCFVWISEQTAITCLYSFYNREGVFTARYRLNLRVM
jgi:hypothetical protein